MNETIIATGSLVARFTLVFALSIGSALVFGALVDGYNGIAFGASLFVGTYAAAMAFADRCRRVPDDRTARSFGRYATLASFVLMAGLVAVMLASEGRIDRLAKWYARLHDVSTGAWLVLSALYFPLVAPTLSWLLRRLAVQRLASRPFGGG